MFAVNTTGRDGWAFRVEQQYMGGFLDSELFDIIWPKLKAHYVMMIFSIVRLRIVFPRFHSHEFLLSFFRSFCIFVSNKQKGDGNVINSKHNGKALNRLAFSVLVVE